MASIIRLADPLDGFSTSRLLYAGHADSGRDDGTIWVSYDEGETWGDGRLLEPGSFAYCVAQVIDCDTIGTIYETSNYGRIRLGLFSLQWQSQGEDTLENEGPCIDCLADLTGDGLVGVNDLLAVIADWGNPYDVNDLLLVIQSWGECP